jgi:hypothetical protein
MESLWRSCVLSSAQVMRLLVGTRASLHACAQATGWSVRPKAFWYVVSLENVLQACYELIAFGYVYDFACELIADLCQTEGFDECLHVSSQRRCVLGSKKLMLCRLFLHHIAGCYWRMFYHDGCAGILPSCRALRLGFCFLLRLCVL